MKFSTYSFKQLLSGGLLCCLILLAAYIFQAFFPGSKPDPSLYEAIRETGKETYLFGDASSVAQALEAVRDGVNIALKL